MKQMLYIYKLLYSCTLRSRSVLQEEDEKTNEKVQLHQFRQNTLSSISHELMRSRVMKFLDMRAEIHQSIHWIFVKFLLNFSLRFLSFTFQNGLRNLKDKLTQIETGR